MKKYGLCVLALCLALALCACGAKEPEPTLAGGWTEAEDGALSQEARDNFARALEGYDGPAYEPVALVATQVVAGQNCKYLCNVPGESGQKYVTVYIDLSGNCEITAVEDAG